MTHDGYDSAERAWLTPPDPWGSDGEDDPLNPYNILIKWRKCKNMKLYEISTDYADFIAAFENGEIPEEAFADTLDGIHEIFEDKCVNVALSVKNDEAMITALEAEIKRLQERVKSVKSSQESKKKYIFDNMQRVGVDKIKSDPRAQLTIKKNPPKVTFADKATFLYQAREQGWTKYLTTPQPELNTAAIKEDLNNGMTIPGVYLEQGSRLEVS